MRKIVDMLEIKFDGIGSNPLCIHDKKFIMGMFDNFAGEIEPFFEYLKSILKGIKAFYMPTGEDVAPTED